MQRKCESDKHDIKNLLDSRPILQADLSSVNLRLRASIGVEEGEGKFSALNNAASFFIPGVRFLVSTLHKQNSSHIPPLNPFDAALYDTTLFALQV